MRTPDNYCPACRWRPGPDARWSCLPSCGTIWNTFTTGGVCPGCGVRWQRTQCLSCRVVSLHRDWYHDPKDDPATHRKRGRKVTA